MSIWGVPEAESGIEHSVYKLLSTMSFTMADLVLMLSTARHYMIK